MFDIELLMCTLLVRYISNLSYQFQQNIWSHLYQYFVNSWRVIWGNVTTDIHNCKSSNFSTLSHKSWKWPLSLDFENPSSRKMHYFPPKSSSSSYPIQRFKNARASWVWRVRKEQCLYKHNHVRHWVDSNSKQNWMSSIIKS